MTHENADKLLADPDLVDDLALDFIEQEVGRIDFIGNWPNFFQRERRMTQWLEHYGYERSLAPAVLARIGELHSRAYTWPYK